MVYSEFGRRLQENLAAGTDHGTANQVFLTGGGLREYQLASIGSEVRVGTDGNLRYQTDFRKIYQTILQKWLGVDPRSILSDTYNTLDFLG